MSQAKSALKLVCKLKMLPRNFFHPIMLLYVSINGRREFHAIVEFYFVFLTSNPEEDSEVALNWAKQPPPPPPPACLSPPDQLRRPNALKQPAVP